MKTARSGRIVAHPEITQEETLETETVALFHISTDLPSMR
jgi:hypothetical protein